MFRFLKQLAEMLRGSGFTLRELIGFGQELAGLGPPPALEDEADLREWLRGLSDVLAVMAEETPTEIDDAGMDILCALLANDSAWAVAYSALVMVFGEEEVLASVPMTSAPVPLQVEAATIAMALEDPASETPKAFDPLTIIMIIRIIAEIIRQLRR